MERQKRIIKTSIIGILINVLLSAFKAMVGFFANSIAVILDAINNLSDALSSIVTIIGIKIAGKEPDNDHPYGHGRIEYFTSQIIGIIILLAGILALKQSIEKIIKPVELNYTLASLLIIIMAIITKYILAKYYEKVGQEIKSDSLIASGIDAFSDAIISLSTFISAIISVIWHINIEGFLGIIISMFIIKNSIEILRTNINALIGVRVNSELAAKIKKDINKFDLVLGTYDLILHNYGPTNLIGAVNIEVNDNLTAKEIHTLTRKINHDIYKKYNIFLTIGIYASNDSDKKTKQIKKYLSKILANYPEVLNLHAFYIEEDNNVITFDLIIDFASDRKQIKKEIIAKMQEKYPDYVYHVVLDSNYSD